MSKLAEHVVCEGVDPAWQLKLTRGPDMKQFNERFVHEKIMVKEYLGTSVRQVKMKKSCRSISAALLACKCYKWEGERFLGKWALEVDIHEIVRSSKYCRVS